MTLERTPAGELAAAGIGGRVRLQAWVHRRRDMGGLLFLDLRDRSGLAQAVIYPDEAPEAHRALEPVRTEWVVEVEGVLLRREKPNPQLPTGEVEVRVDRAEVLSPSAVPPFVLDSWGEASEETRLKHRYYELRRPELQKNFVLRSDVSFAVRKYLHGEGFVDLETPILTRSTPEGARDYLVPSRIYPGQFYALPQSPQIFKQLLMVSGFERYYQVARCFRDEDLRADRQPEFTQIDLEMSFIREQDIYHLIEGLFAAVFPLAGITPPASYPHLTYAEAMARYGSDRPDLRFGLEIADLSAELGGSGFRAFAGAVAEGGVVRGFTVPGAAAASRKRLDGWAKLAQRHGAAGVLTLRKRGGEVVFQVKKALDEGELSAAADALALEDDGLALLAAGDEATVAKALGALRVALAGEYGLIPEDRHAFVWVTEFPLFEWSQDEGRWSSTHHPFTSPDPRDLQALESDPGKVRSRAYDVVMDGLELGGGSIRIHRRDTQERVFNVLGIAPGEAERRFGHLLHALQYGAPPHGGIALGYDRMVMKMAGAPSIRDVILFPKTASATCLMTEAPSPVDAAQMEELGLAPLAED